MALLLRASLVFTQAVANHLACTPPNKTPTKGRYHTEEAYVLQIAPIHTLLLWLSATFEAVSALNLLLRRIPVTPRCQPTCQSTRSQNLLTPIFVTGVVLSALGTLIRVQCFRELGELFTFDLSVLPEHKLVTSGFYHYVRHPAYTGSMLLIIGITLSHLTPGSLAVECSALGRVGSGLLWATWWIWSLAVAQSRAVAEDIELRKLFGPQWDAYAARVKFWFVPGLL
ncbi:hypothetical protein BU15DRAFT_52962 [Melanogaster broomeanus]|nr:hypothetical protein BU15DRAFT_52962 [Melanogaster broomeanus]